MCSTFMPRNNFNSAYSKSQYEAPKQLLQLRSQVKPLLSPSLSESTDSAFSRSSHSPQPNPGNQKLCLAFIEKDKRGLSSGITTLKMKSSSQYQAFDRPNHHSRKTAQAPLMRTPSSGFSSSSSSENMFSGLSISSDSDQKLRDIMDPSIEVDLDMFLAPEARYTQPIPMAINTSSSLTASRGNLSTSLCHSQSVAPKALNYLQQVKQSQPFKSPYLDYSYSNVKRSSGYTDYMPTHSVSGSLPSTSSVPMSPGSWIRCTYCWETYVKLCQRVANQDPVVTCEGPWQWHSLYDSQGRVTCPRLWFTQLERAGADMLAQMTINARNVPV